MILRIHQEDVICQLEAEIKFGGKRIFIDACPAYGKSLVMSDVARRFQKDGVIILINITALLDQISEHLTEQGVKHSILKADRPGEFDRDCNVQLVMSQTLHSWIKKNTLKQTWVNKFKIYQQDEGHRENYDVSKRTKDIIDYLAPECEVLYSGTPYDSEGFRFHKYEYLSNVHAKELEEKGYLCPIKCFVPRWAEGIDYSSVKSNSNGDYNNAELEKIIATKEHMLKVVDSMNDMDAKNKKTIVFCSSIEQADLITNLLKEDGYSAESFHSKSENGDLILNAFINNSSYMLNSASKQGSLFEGEDNSEPEFGVKCLVSINKLGIGFDCPDIKLAVQTRPTAVRSLYIQQIMRVARTHPSKQFAEYLDLAQTVSKFGFHTDTYLPPIKTNDRDRDKKLIKEANHGSLDDLIATLDMKGMKEITRKSYDRRIKEVKALLRRDLADLSIPELASAFEISKDHKEIIQIATLIYTYKFGQPISKKGFQYNYRPESYWGTSDFGDPRFHVPLTMQQYFDKYPEMKNQWIKALKTRCRNIIKEEAGLFRITGFIKFMADKYEEESYNFMDEYTKKKNDEANNAAKSLEITIEENDSIPF